MAWITSRWRAVLLALVIFVAGGVCGIVGQRAMIVRTVFERGGPGGGRGGFGPGGDRLLERFVRNLELSEEQREQVRQILDESRERMMTHRHEVQEQLRELSSDTRDRIGQLLTPEQRERLESSFGTFFRQGGPKHRRGRRGGGGPPPGN